jgi:hypothetical protein
MSIDVQHHPIGLIVDDDLHRSRLSVFFRLLLAIPQAIWLLIWGIAVYFLLFVVWVIALITGRVPDSLHGFLGHYLRANTHLAAYLFLLANPWPPFDGAPGQYPVDVRVDPAVPQSRLTIFFRLLLAIPAFLLAYVFRLVNQMVAFIGWFYCLVMGEMNRGMRDLSAWMLRYEVQTYAYAMLLTGRYPSFESLS